MEAAPLQLPDRHRPISRMMIIPTFPEYLEEVLDACRAGELARRGLDRVLVKATLNLQGRESTRDRYIMCLRHASSISHDGSALAAQHVYPFTVDRGEAFDPVQQITDQLDIIANYVPGEQLGLIATISNVNSKQGYLLLAKR